MFAQRAVGAAGCLNTSGVMPTLEFFAVSAAWKLNTKTPDVERASRVAHQPWIQEPAHATSHRWLSASRAVFVTTDCVHPGQPSGRNCCAREYVMQGEFASIGMT